MNKQPLTEGKTRGQIKPLRKGSNPLPSGTIPPPPPNPPNVEKDKVVQETREMKIWSHNKFKGHWPVAAVVIAETREEAGFLLNEQLDQMGLPFCNPDLFEEIPMKSGVVRILRGNY